MKSMVYCFLQMLQNVADYMSKGDIRMSVKKRAASVILALGMLASTAPAFAVDSTSVSGDLVVQNSAAVSKNVAAQDHSYIALGASVKGQSVVAGQTMDVAVFVYMHQDSDQNGERAIFNISKGGKSVYSEAVPFNDFDADAGLYTMDWELDTSDRDYKMTSAGTYTLEFYTQYWSNGGWKTVEGTRNKENVTVVKKAVGLNGISLADENGKKVTSVTIEKKDDSVGLYDIQFNPQNTTVNREAAVSSANNNIVVAEDLAGTVAVYPTGYGKTSVTATVNGKSTTLQVFVPNPNSSNVIDLYSDVNTGDWFLGAVQYAYDQKIMNGVGNYRFAPNENLTRAQVAQILYAREGKPAVSGEVKFTDVPKDQWYYNAVLWASQNGVVNGYANGMFRPDSDITREQLARMLYSYTGSPAVSGNLNGFADGSKVSDWAQDAVIWATSTHVINGKYVNGKLCIDPQGNATRAEAATMMKNYLGG